MNLTELWPVPWGPGTERLVEDPLGTMLRMLILRALETLRR